MQTAYELKWVWYAWLSQPICGYYSMLCWTQGCYVLSLLGLLLMRLGRKCSGQPKSSSLDQLSPPCFEEEKWRVWPKEHLVFVIFIYLVSYLSLYFLFYSHKRDLSPLFFFFFFTFLSVSNYICLLNKMLTWTYSNNSKYTKKYCIVMYCLVIVPLLYNTKFWFGSGLSWSLHLASRTIFSL